MDPTAPQTNPTPKDENLPSNQSDGPLFPSPPPIPDASVQKTQSSDDLIGPESPIEPGQFVVFEDKRSTTPTPDLSQKPNLQNEPLLKENANNTTFSQPIPKLNLATTSNRSRTDIPSQSYSGPQPAPNFEDFNKSISQDPLASFPKIPQPETPDETTAQMPQPPQPEQSTPQPSSRIDQLKKVAIYLGILILIGTIAAVAWLFFLQDRVLNRNQTPEEINESQVEEPPPFPKRSNGAGFADLPPIIPQATAEATEQASSSDDEEETL